MVATIPSVEPSKIYQGDTVTWKKTVDDYPASAGWTLKYAIQGPTNVGVISASADGAAHLIEIAKATTAGWTAGDYWYQAFVEDGTERVTLYRGQFELVKSLDTGISGAYDGKSHYQTVLSALKATLEGKASKDQLSYSIRGRSISRMTLTEITDAIATYERLVKKEERDLARAQGKPVKSNKVRTRFSS